MKYTVERRLDGWSGRGPRLGADGRWELELPARPSSAEGRELVAL